MFTQYGPYKINSNYQVPSSVAKYGSGRDNINKEVNAAEVRIHTYKRQMHKRNLHKCLTHERRGNNSYSSKKIENSKSNGHIPSIGPTLI